MSNYSPEDDDIERMLKKLRSDTALSVKFILPLTANSKAAGAVRHDTKTSPVEFEACEKSLGVNGNHLGRKLKKTYSLLRKKMPYNLFFSDLHNTTENKKRISHDLDSLLKYEDEDFIIQAYRVLLERDPDPDGIREHIRHLRTGSKTKIDILAGIRFYSDEGLAHDIIIKGLRKHVLLKKALHLPLFGYCARWALLLLQLPRLTRTLAMLKAKVATDGIRLKKSLYETKASQEINFKIIGEEIISIKEILSYLKEEKQLLQNEIAKLSNELSAAQIAINDQKREILEQQRNHTRLLEEAGGRMLEPFSPEKFSGILNEKKWVHDALYASFEDTFRGGREEIKNRARIYLPYLERHVKDPASEPIVDLGCGRGEWIELLKENNYLPTGIDSNSSMIQECMDRGLPVIESGAIEFLRGQKENSISVLTGFHIVEHLEFEKIIMLLDESLHALRPGGMIIIETPNPENILVGSCNFYSDPTHKNPIPPNTLRFFVEKRGFRNIEIIRLHPPDTIYRIEDIPGSLSKIFNTEQDYSVIAYK